jgi:hypothetical protein
MLVEHLHPHIWGMVVLSPHLNGLPIEAWLTSHDTIVREKKKKRFSDTPLTTTGTVRRKNILLYILSILLYILTLVLSEETLY